MSVSLQQMKQIVSIISEDLGIDPPPIVLSNIKTLGTKAGKIAFPSGRLLIRPNLPFPETLLTIAHELRHLWQYRNGLFSESISREHYIDSSVGFEAYALQPCEVDANAYARLVSEDILGMRPLWKGYSEDVKAAIEKRYCELANEVK